MRSPLPSRLRRLQLVAVGLVLLLGSCTSSSAEKSLTTRPDPTRPAAVRADLPEVVAKAQRAMILAERAGNVLIDRCMEAKGFEFFGPVDTHVGIAEGGVTIGSLTPQVAKTEGYGLYILSPSYGRILSPDEPDPTDDLRQAGREYLESLSPEEQQRFTEALSGGGDEESVVFESGVGVNMGGCVGQSRRELLGDRVLDVFETFNTVQFLQVDVSEDRSVRDAERAWEACMRESGYRFERPSEAVEAGFLMRGDAVDPSQEEVALAVADAECRLRIVEAVEEAFASMSKETVRENEQLLASWAEMERFVLESAGEVLGVRLTQGP